MRDPTTAMRTMYYSALSTIVTLYEGMAPADASGTYAVITATNFQREPAIKQVFSCTFSTTFEIYQEFVENGNSEGVDTIADQICDAIIPIDQNGYLLTVTGFSISDIVLSSGSNDAFQIASLVTFRKTITIVHSLTQNRS